VKKVNHLAWHLIGGAPGWGRKSGAAANLWCDIEAKRACNIYVEPGLRSIYLRSRGGMQSIFAYESFMDELASALRASTPSNFVEVIGHGSQWRSSCRPGTRAPLALGDG